MTHSNTAQQPSTSELVAALRTAQAQVTHLETLIREKVTTEETTTSDKLKASLSRSLAAGVPCRTVAARPSKWCTRTVNTLLDRQSLPKTMEDVLRYGPSMVVRELAWTDLLSEFADDTSVNFTWMIFEKSWRQAPREASSWSELPWLKSCRILMVYPDDALNNAAVYSTRYPAFSIYEHSLVFIETLDEPSHLQQYDLDPNTWPAPTPAHEE